MCEREGERGRQGEREVERERERERGPKINCARFSRCERVSDWNALSPCFASSRKNETVANVTSSRKPTRARSFAATWRIRLHPKTKRRTMSAGLLAVLKWSSKKNTEPKVLQWFFLFDLIKKDPDKKASKEVKRRRKRRQVFVNTSHLINLNRWKREKQTIPVQVELKFLKKKLLAKLKIWLDEMTCKRF